jgi:RNA polymerase sigma factor (sigma-70 family)
LNFANKYSAGSLFLFGKQWEKGGMTETVVDTHPRVPGSSGAAQAEELGSVADEELLHRYRNARGAQAFTEMVRRHRPMVLRTCLRLVGNLHDAEDAAQAVFLVLAQRPQVVRHSLVGCLIGLARAAVSELCRSRRRRREREELAARLNSLFARLRGKDHALEHQELREELDSALARLPDRLQQAVILRYLEGHSQQEAARRAGCTQATLGWRAMKGIQRLRTILARRGTVLAPAVLAACLTAEARAAIALAPAGAPAGKVTATATRLAATLVRRSLLGKVFRRALLVGTLLIASMALGAGIAWLPAGDKNTPAHHVLVPAGPKPASRPLLTLGLFDHDLDIGGPSRTGSAQYGENAYSLKGGGGDIFGKADQFRFVCRQWKGDGEIIARVAFGRRLEAERVAAGVMFRESLMSDCLHMAVVLSRGECHVIYRTPTIPGSQCQVSPVARGAKHWVRLVRQGNKLTAYVRADDEEEWKHVTERELALGPSPYVGLAVTARNDARLASATFDHVSLRSGK